MLQVSTSRGVATLELGDRGTGVLRAAGAGAQLVGGVGVEVAVPAPGRAERDMQVEPERTRRGLVDSRLRQRPVPGRNLPLGQCRRHALHGTDARTPQPPTYDPLW